MSYPSRFVACLVAVTLGSVLLPACGGEFSEDGDESASGSGGQAGSAGKSGSGGSAGTGRGGSGTGATGGSGGTCEFGGQTYYDGDTFPAGDDCNTCTCSGGQIGCTALGCPEEGCVYDGVFYQVGEEFPAGDGCNSCSCTAGGTVGCTLIACNDCSAIESEYEIAIDQARTCDPTLTGQCSQQIFVGLQCGCDSFVNPENASAIEVAQAEQAKYAEQQCGGDVLCGECAPPVSSYCSAEGRCVDVYEFGPGASCKVDGQVYASGTANVPDPVSCNTCTCIDGYLECSDGAYCPEECPPDTVYDTQCAQCGAGDGCEVIEHACLPTCTDSCQEGVCIQGVCKSLCG